MSNRGQRNDVSDAMESALDLSPERVDEMYGLEPVFEPSREARGELATFAEIQCPWCGEVSGTNVDLSVRDLLYIEDCQVCCRAMQLTIEFDDAGHFTRVATERSD